MIWSGFTFFNELDLLKLRLEETRGLDIVHILVESKYTFKGDEKPLYFDAVKDQFKEFNIAHVVWSPAQPDKDPWVNERNQRNAMMAVMKNARPDDICIVTDVDEVVSKNAIMRYPKKGIANLEMKKYGYYLNCLEGEWHIGKIFMGADLKRGTPDQIRNAGAEFTLADAGWHWSFQGGVDAILEKFASFSHQEEAVQRHANREILLEKFKTGQSIWGEDHWKMVPLDETFPKYLLEHKEEYRHMIYELKNSGSTVLNPQPPNHGY